MTANDKLKDVLRNERSKIGRSVRVSGRQIQVLGTFLTAALTQTKQSPEDLAKALNMELVLVSGILEGLLPDSELDDVMLVELAHAVNIEPNVLRIILGRDIVPVREVSEQGD